MSAYLMVFHKDEDHGLHMAISPDGYTFTALNEGKPVIAGDTIAEQKGIRDPHIFRGPDGAFYLSMTDLHIYAQRDGYRDTEWERDGKEYGWVTTGAGIDEILGSDSLEAYQSAL